METFPQTATFDRILDRVVDCFTPGVAHQIADLRADPPLQSRLDELARKASEGILTDAELWEYRGCVEAIDVIGVLQIKARAACETT